MCNNKYRIHTILEENYLLSENHPGTTARLVVDKVGDLRH